jgi:hypothetical protein
MPKPAPFPVAPALIRSLRHGCWKRCHASGFFTPCLGRTVGRFSEIWGPGGRNVSGRFHARKHGADQRQTLAMGGAEEPGGSRPRGDGTARRSPMVRCRWRGKSPSPASGFKGAAKRSFVEGCRESEVFLASDQPAARLNGGKWFNAMERHGPGGCNGDAPAGPLAKMVRYYRTHLAVSAKRTVLMEHAMRTLLTRDHQMGQMRQT